MKRNLKTVTVIGVGLCIITLLFVSELRQPSQTVSRNNPGYFEQYLEMKKNESGIIPQGVWKDWMEYDRLSKKKESGVFSSVVEIGPSNIGGRTRAIVIDRLNPSRIYAGGVSGGMWISNNKGASWEPVNDFAPNLAVTSIIQSPFDENILYYSTGEPTGNSTEIPGAGIFKSTNRGQSYEQLEATDNIDFRYIWRLEHSRTDKNTIYAGTSTAGLFKSIDGGETFENIHATSAGIRDIESFGDSTVWYSIRGAGIFKYDERTGKSNKMTNGLPISNFSYIDIDYCESQPGIAYAVIIDASNRALNGIYKTVDSGQSWNKTTSPTGVSFDQGWYDLVIEVDPDDPDFVVVGAQSAGYTSNGGDSWDFLANSHSDYHVAAFFPGTNEYLIGNDGGIYAYNQFSSSTSFSNLNNGYNVTQYYAGYYFPEGNDVMGGTQDNGTNLNRNGSSTGITILGADGSFCAVDQLNETVYASWQNGELRRKLNINSGGWSNISFGLKSVIPATTDIWFINPFELNPVDGSQIYFITRNNLVRSVNSGTSWELASDRFIGNGYSAGITRQDNPTIYVGGSSGVLFRLEQAKTASKVVMTPLYTSSPAGAKGSFIGNIEINPQNESSIYLAMTNYSLNPRIWKVMNADAEVNDWLDISGNLPPNLPVNWIEVDPLDSNIIMIGTDNGLYTSTNGGGWWQKDETVPNVKVDMIRLRETDRRLYLFTHGRGIWMAQMKNVDDIAGVKEQKLEIRVFPNPSSDFIKMEGLDVLNYSIISSDGKTLIKGVGNNADIRRLNPGNYFLQVVSDEGIAVQQFRKI